ncbi:MAG: LPS export ABC transporter permease LptG [Paracoccaceae bacterium]
MMLTFYVARRFLATFFMVLLAFFIILTLIDMIEQIRRAPDESFSTLAGLALLHTPRTAYNILPLIMILTAISFFLRLARSSELVAMRAAGRSALRTLMAPALMALLLGAIAVGLANPIVAATSKRYETQIGNRLQISAETSVEGDGLWMRQGDENGQWVIHARSADPDGLHLKDVTFLSFGNDGRPLARINAEAASLSDGAWIATNAREWQLDNNGIPEATVNVQASLSLTSSLTPDQIRDSFGRPSDISIWDIPGHIRQLERAGFSSRRHAVWLQMELALPLMLVAMVLVGEGFTMRHARFGNSGLLVLMALVCGIAVFFVRNFAQVLGDSGQIPVILAAWSPPIAAALLSFSLLLHLEDG